MYNLIDEKKDKVTKYLNNFIDNFNISISKKNNNTYKFFFLLKKRNFKAKENNKNFIKFFFYKIKKINYKNFTIKLFIFYLILSISYNILNGLFTFLQYLVINFSLIIKKKIQSELNVCFVSFYIGKKFKKKKYSDNYWKFFEQIENKSQKIYLNHTYINRRNNYRNISKLEKYKIDMNNNYNETKIVFIEQYLYLLDIFRILFLYFKIIKHNIFFILNYLKKSNQFGKILFNDIIEELVGSSTIRNIIFHYSFKNFISCNNKLKKIFFLSEGQEWEDILVQNCREKKIQTIAYLNSFIKYWDCNYYKYKNKKLFPLPDKFLVESYHNKRKLIKAGIPLGKIKKIKTSKFKINKKKTTNLNLNKINILVLLSFIKSETVELIELVKKVSKDKPNFKFYLKYHPANQHNFNNDKSSNILKYLKKNIEFNKFDYAIVANDSAASIDCYLNGLKFFIYRPKNKLNNNFLFEYNKNIFFSNPNILVNKLISKKHKILKFSKIVI